MDLNTSDTSTIGSSAALSTTSVAVQGLLRFAYSFVIGRVLGPALLASTNGAISAAMFASLLWPTAAATTATRYVAQALGAGDNALAGALASHLGKRTIAASMVLAVPVSAFTYFALANHDLATALFVALLVVAWSGYTFVRGLYFAIGQLRRAAFWDALTACVSIGALVAVALFGVTPLLLAPLCLSYATYAIIGWPRAQASVSISREYRREIDRFTFWGVVASVSLSGLLQLSMILAQIIGPAHEAGLYAAAMSLATPLSLLSSVVTLMLFPSMSHAAGRNDRRAIARQADSATRALLVLVTGGFGTLAVLASPVMILAYGENYADADWLFRLLLFASLFVSLNGASNNAISLITKSGMRAPALISSGGFICGLLSMIGMQALWGIRGVAAGYLVGGLIIGLVPVCVLWVRLKMRWTMPFTRAGVALAIFVLASVSVDLFRMNVWASAGIATLALCAWVALSLPELRMINSMRRTPRAAE